MLREKMTLTVVEKSAMRREVNALVDVFLANGGKIEKCRCGKYHIPKKRGNAILGRATQGREALWGGKRWIYS